MNKQHRLLFIACSVVVGSVLYAQNQFVTSKKKRPSHKVLKEEIAQQWEHVFSNSVDCMVTLVGMQQRLLKKRASIEHFVGNADGAVLQDHRARLEMLNNRFEEFQKNCLQLCKTLETDIEKFCIT